jgi:hypothetical protein
LYEYKFVKIDLKTSFRGVSPTEDYHLVIERYASEGWKLVQIFAPPVGSYGVSKYFELIFEKENQK